LLALVVFWVVGTGNLGWGAAFMTLAWLTDSLDGRLARSTSHPSRLGAWDLRVDTTFAIGLLLGLGTAERVPWLLVAGVLGLALVTMAIGNPAPGMLMQGFSYGWLLVLLFIERPIGWWLPVAGALLLMILDWHRFTRVVLPAFFKGSAALVRPTTAPDTRTMLDEWA
jgi:hypothetical protein